MREKPRHPGVGLLKGSVGTKGSSEPGFAAEPTPFAEAIAWLAPLYFKFDSVKICWFTLVRET